MSIADRSHNQNPGRYLELIKQFPLRPIRNDAELDQAIRMVDALLDKAHLELEEEDYLEVLSGLVHQYETDAHPESPLPDAEMLQHLIEAKGVSQTALSQETGIAVSTISEVLSGKRALNRRLIGSLAEYFGVSPNVFAF